MEQNIIEINSLTDYIREIEKIPSQSYFRGEDKNYSEQRACAFRKYTGFFNSPKPYPFIKMIDEFYKETAYKLNDDKIDFIAFAQHYGIPTNLLDITLSPLTALYFACQGYENKKGYIYTMSEAGINVTELIHKYPNQNLIDKVFSNTTNELKQLIPLFIEFNEKYPKEFYNLLDILIDKYLIYFKKSVEGRGKNFSKFIE